MKYFKAANKVDPKDSFYLSCSCDINNFGMADQLKLYGYSFIECTKEEYETMTQERNDHIINDYIIKVGRSKAALRPFDSAHTPKEAVDKAKEYTEDWEYVEIVYMPVDNDDINEVVWTWHSGI